MSEGWGVECQNRPKVPARARSPPLLPVCYLPGFKVFPSFRTWGYSFQIQEVLPNLPFNPASRTTHENVLFPLKLGTCGNDLEWVFFSHMLELTGFPGIEVIVSLCFTLLLITWSLQQGGDRKGRLQFHGMN